MAFLELENKKQYPFGASDAAWQVPMLYKDQKKIENILLEFLEGGFLGYSI